MDRGKIRCLDYTSIGLLAVILALLASYINRVWQLFGLKSSLSVGWSDKELLEKKIEFASLAFQNAQELAQRADGKASFVLAANGLLISFLASIIPELKSIIWQMPLSFWLVFHGVVFVLFTLALIASISCAFMVFYPRPVGSQISFKKKHLLFYWEIAKSYSNHREYIQALRDASPDDLLANLGYEVHCVSIVADTKFNLARRSTLYLGLAFVFWLAFLLNTFLLFQP